MYGLFDLAIVLQSKAILNKNVHFLEVGLSIIDYFHIYQTHHLFKILVTDNLSDKTSVMVKRFEEQQTHNMLEHFCFKVVSAFNIKEKRTRRARYTVRDN